MLSVLYLFSLSACKKSIEEDSIDGTSSVASGVQDHVSTTASSDNALHSTTAGKQTTVAKEESPFPVDWNEAPLEVTGSSTTATTSTIASGTSTATTQDNVVATSASTTTQPQKTKGTREPGWTPDY